MNHEPKSCMKTLHRSAIWMCRKLHVWKRLITLPYEWVTNWMYAYVTHEYELYPLIRSTEITHRKWVTNWWQIWTSHELNVCIRYSWVSTLSAYSVHRNHTSKMSHELMADMNESRTKCMHTLLMSMHSSIRLFGLPKPHIENESRTDGRYENASSLPHMNKSRTEWVRTPSICQVYRDDTSKKSHELKAHTTHLCHLEIHTIMEHKAFAQEALNLDLHQHRPLTQT